MGEKGGFLIAPPELAYGTVRTSHDKDIHRKFLVLERHVVTTDGANPLLAPDLHALAYLSGGSAFVRSFTRMTLAEIKEASDPADHERAIDDAKQIESALARYAADCDGEFPPGDRALDQTASPSVRDPAVLQAVVYRFLGGALPKPEEAGQFLVGPGGRAENHAEASVS